MIKFNSYFSVAVNIKQPIGKTLFVVSYIQIVENLQELSNSKRSGTLFIKTEDNKSARFTLDRGNIVGCCYRVKKGLEALPFVLTIDTASISFSDKLILDKPDANFPGNAKLFEILINRVKPEIQTSAIQPKTSNSLSPKNKMLASKTEVIISELKTILTEYVGPMATPICANYTQDKDKIFADHNEFQRMVGELATEIGNTDEGEEFKSRVFEMVTKLTHL